MVIMRIRNGNGFTEDIRRDRHGITHTIYSYRFGPCVIHIVNDTNVVA